MKRTTRCTRTAAAAVLLLSALPGAAQVVSEQEARGAAEAWTRAVVAARGSWGQSLSPSVESVEPITEKGRSIGYLCRISPEGYVVVSLRRELAPVQGFYDRGSFPVDRENPLGRTLRPRMLATVEGLEAGGGDPRQPAPALTTDHRPAWEALLGGAAIPVASVQLPLTTAWHQHDPYNRWCPSLVGSEACTHALVGCVGTAAAQIMRYWAWPPNGSSWPANAWYRWGNMPDAITAGSPAAEIDAVAELSLRVAEAAGTDFGCSSSSAWLGERIGTDMTDAFKDVFRYHADVNYVLRFHHGDDSWFNLVKADLDMGRPVQYGLYADNTSNPGYHSTVCDGWMTSLTQRLFHMNYGWGDTFIWLDITNIAGAESAIRNIRPAGSLGPALSGTYGIPAYPYRYLERDATGEGVVFLGGQSVQFFPGVSVRCTSLYTGTIAFRGSATAPMRLYSYGGDSRGVVITGGHLTLYTQGSVRLYR